MIEVLPSTSASHDLASGSLRLDAHHGSQPVAVASGRESPGV